MRSLARRAALGALVLVFACSRPQPPAPGQAPPPTAATAWKPFELGTWHRAVSTRNADAQRAFDQGLIWAYAFNHDEAMRAFDEAARLDPQLAMAAWGIALVNGPHINNPFVDEAHGKAAWEALGRARALASGASDVERALIDALGARYAMPQPVDRTALDRAYADAMRAVHARFPDDPDVATLTAEALLDVHPWDQWAGDGSPKEGTREILALLEHAQKLAPQHPGALHLWVHSFEASPTPERAAAAAEALRTLVPDSSHLVHMPGHIDVRLGKWALGADTNEKAIAADERYLARKPHIGFYALYMLHNVHFLAFTAMMEGRSAVAIARCDEVVRALPPEKVREAPLLMDSFQTVALDARKRFGHWDEILATPAPLPEFPVASAYWHSMRAIALAATGKLDGAAQERAAFTALLAKVPKDALWGSNTAQDVLAVSVPYVDGEIAYARHDLATAVAKLTEAVRLEDALKFDDPPPCTVPSRHALGAVLLEAKRPAEAEVVYRADLRRFPENGWSLAGLAKALAAQGRKDEAGPVDARARAAWARADVPMGASCACVKVAAR